MKALMYQTPFLYDFIVKMLHGSYRDYEIVAGMVEGKDVLDVACGTGMLAKYLSAGARYEGWELNERFIESARKKGLNVSSKNAFELGNEKKKWDTIVVKDFLHHIYPDEKKLLAMLKRKTEYAVICEPILDKKRAKDIIFGGRMMNFVHNLVGDSDSFNHFDSGRKFQEEYDRDRLVAEIAKVGKIVEKKQSKEMLIVKARIS